MGSLQNTYEDEDVPVVFGNNKKLRNAKQANFRLLLAISRIFTNSKVTK